MVKIMPKIPNLIKISLRFWAVEHGTYDKPKKDIIPKITFLYLMTSKWVMYTWES